VVLGFGLLCINLLLNNFLGGFKIFTQILAYGSIYFSLAFWLKPLFWKRSFFVFLLLILTLPILERLQKFVGFPIRLITAKVVGILLQFLGTGNISQSTIITTENYATTIDLPCSGVKSLYFGGIILAIVYFLQQIKISFKACVVALIFFLLLFFFNIWRVFGLVYVYGVLHFQEVGNIIHVGLGIFGFAVSCIFLWYSSEYLRKDVSQDHEKSSKKVKLFSTPHLRYKNLSHRTVFWICSSFLIITGILSNTLIKLPTTVLQVTASEKILTLPQSDLEKIPFTDKENTLFVNKDVSFAGKYAVNWHHQKEFSILLVESTSARSHHDPEVCLQGLGYRLVSENTLLVGSAPINEIQIQTSDDSQSPKASVYYWFVSKDKIITDYSERVWNQFQHPNEQWVLIEVAVLEPQQISNEELQPITNELTQSVREQVL
jgi:exosortase O